ncbi:MAG: cysteine desulfurase [Pirellulales bacterium]|nr:cysteine desulfurase [Pirellulales bacterium]
MPPPPIYLDHNATAPILSEVAEAVRDAAIRYPGNPASQHELGRQARRALEAARQRIGELLGARTAGMDADQVIFTSGGTESNNLALHGLHKAATGGRGPLHKAGDAIADPPQRLIISALEHPSIARTAEHLATTGCHIERIGVTPQGVIRIDHLESLLAADTQLVSVMLASNETGVLQPFAEIAALCRQRGVPLHTDAVQAVGKIPVHFRDLGVDALTAAAHKFHGPLGIGVLVVRHGVPLASSLQGGFQQSALRPGTESVALAIGMQTALELWQREANARRERMTNLRDEFEQAILADYPDAIVIGADAPRLPHTSNIAFTGLNRQALVMALDLAGVACSTGSACASGSSEPSPTLLAMGLSEEVISSSVRFSLGATTTAAEVAEAARRILSVCNHLRHEK